MTQPTVNTNSFLSNVQAQLDGHVVGYSCVIGDANGDWPYSYGDARTVIDTPQPPGGVVPPGDRQTTAGPPPGSFQPPVAVRVTAATPFGIASASKLLTALAAVQLLDGPSVGDVAGTPVAGLTLDSPMYQSLPEDWDIYDPPPPAISPVKLITFRDLLMHTSGLPEYPPPGLGEDYASLQKFLSQETVITATPLPSPLPFPAPRYPVSYSNVGFALFRILLPMVHSVQAPPGSNWWKDNPDLPVDGPQGRAQSFANEYERIIQDNVFGRVHVTGPCTGTPSGNSYAFGYTFPGGSPGTNQSSEDLQLQAGPGAWFVSIDQICPVLQSLSNIDGNILTAEQWNHMQNIDVPPAYENTGNGLGIDELTDSGTGYRWVEKNGGYENQMASIAFFGSMIPDGTTNGPLYAALFVNSDIWGGPGSVTGWYQCTRCDTMFYPSNGGICPATGTAKQAHNNWGEYILRTSQAPGGQGDWQQCSNCGALCYEPSSAEPSVCPANGGRHVPTGTTFFLSQSGQNDLEDQAEWRRCENCGVLAFSFGDAGAGVCADGGGEHKFDLSANYSMRGSIGPDIVLLQAFRDSIG